MHRIKTKKNPTGNSLEDLINEAKERGDFDNLPNKGKPLKLDDYFSVHPDHQISSQLLIDNKVIPQPLQDRKDSEALVEEAHEFFEKGVAGLARLQEDIRTYSDTVITVFPDSKTLLATLGLDAWPDYFNIEKRAIEKPVLRRVLNAENQIRRLIRRHNRQATRGINDYMEFLKKADDIIRRLNTGLMEGPVVGGSSMHMRSLNLKELEEQARVRCPHLIPLSGDAAIRLQEYVKEHYPPFWKRWICRIRYFYFFSSLPLT